MLIKSGKNAFICKANTLCWAGFFKEEAPGDICNVLPPPTPPPLSFPFTTFPFTFTIQMKTLSYDVSVITCRNLWSPLVLGPGCLWPDSTRDSACGAAVYSVGFCSTCVIPSPAWCRVKAQGESWAHLMSSDGLGLFFISGRIMWFWVAVIG